MYSLIRKTYSCRVGGEPDRISTSSQKSEDGEDEIWHDKATPVPYPRGLLPVRPTALELTESTPCRLAGSVDSRG